MHNMPRSKDKIPFNCGETGSTGGCLPPPCLLTSPSSSVGELGVVWEGLTVGVEEQPARTRPILAQLPPRWPARAAPGVGLCGLIHRFVRAHPETQESIRVVNWKR